METTGHALSDTISFRVKGAAAASLYLLVVLATGGIMYSLVWQQGGTPPVPPGPQPQGQTQPTLPTIAGTGAALPLVDALVHRFGSQGAGTIDVPPSIGSSGGLAALGDGVIDCALVSRPLRDDEAVGREVVALAHAPISLVAGKEVPDHVLASADAFLSLVARTPDAPAGVDLILREPGDSGQSLLAGAIPGLDAALEQAWNDGTWPVAYTDADMARMLAENPRAVGLLDQGTVALHQLPLKTVGTEITADLHRPFLMVCSPSGRARLGPFVDFLSRQEIQTWIVHLGYLLPEGP